MWPPAGATGSPSVVACLPASRVVVGLHGAGAFRSHLGLLTAFEVTKKQPSKTGCWVHSNHHPAVSLVRQPKECRQGPPTGPNLTPHNESLNQQQRLSQVEPGSNTTTNNSLSKDRVNQTKMVAATKDPASRKKDPRSVRKTHEAHKKSHSKPWPTNPERKSGSDKLLKIRKYDSPRFHNMVWT